MATVGLPLTGAGDATASVATDNIGGEHYQRMKLHDGLDGSTQPVRILATTPAAGDGGLVVRPIGSTGFNQAVVGAVGLTSGSSAVGITSGSSAVELTSAGSTRLVGQVTLANPTTAVSLSSQATVTVGNPTTAVDLSSGGSTKVVGTVNATGTTKVDVSSGVILGAGSSANMLGQVFATGTTQVDVSSGVVLGAGSSANILGQVVQGPGSSVNAWTVGSYAFSSGNLARTTVNTSANVSIIAANAARKGLVIASLSTAQTVALGLSTGAVTTALANANLYLAPGGQLSFGIHGGLPLFLGPVRGINITSTAVAGGVSVMEFT